jgi:predicted nucleic acid-binding protein
MEDFVLADTNVVSYLFKKDTRGSVYKPHIEHKLVFIAAQTFAEIELLPLNNKWSRKRHEKLRENLKNNVFIEASREISVKWAEIQAEA